MEMQPDRHPQTPQQSAGNLKANPFAQTDNLSENPKVKMKTRTQTCCPLDRAFGQLILHQFLI